MPNLSIIICAILGIFLLIGFFVLYRNIQDKKLLETITKSYRGTRSERDLVLSLLKYRIPAQLFFMICILESITVILHR